MALSLEENAGEQSGAGASNLDYRLVEDIVGRRRSGADYDYVECFLATHKRVL